MKRSFFKNPTHDQTRAEAAEMSMFIDAGGELIAEDVEELKKASIILGGETHVGLDHLMYGELVVIDPESPQLPETS